MSRLTPYVDRLPADYEISLRRAFVDARADYIVLDSKHQGFQFQGAQYGRKRGWLSEDRQESEREQYTRLVYRLTPAGRRHFGRKEDGDA